MKIKIIVLLILIASISCAGKKMTSNLNQNPLLQPWVGNYGGVPPFDKVNVADFKSALIKAMDLNRDEINSIANQKESPTFENTIVALEKAGEVLKRVMVVYDLWSWNMSVPEFQSVEIEMQPKISSFQDATFQNSKLFERINSINNSAGKKNLTPEQQRLVWVYYTQFVLHGAKLNKDEKSKVSKINLRLAELYPKFKQNLLADEEDGLLIDQASDLTGLPQTLIDSAATEANRQKKNGKWIIGNTRSSMEPFLTYSSNRALREKAFRKWASRGDNPNANNNNKIVSEIMNLRRERSKIFGYPTFAHWNLSNKMAKDPKNAMDLMLQVWKPAVEKVKEEVSDMQKIVDAEKGKFKIQPWDYRYYAEKVRKAKYDLDMDVVKPYLQLENIRKAMFWMAHELYGFSFEKISDVPVFHPKVTVYKVTGKNGDLVGFWYFDPYARQGKRSGAWMSTTREQSRINGKEIKTIVSNNSNFIEGKEGEPVLISWDDADTMFHEFGHALHGLNSNVTYPTLSGTSTLQDFVEFPSQFSENYLSTPEVLAFLTDQNGKSFPKEMINKIKKTQTFNQGFATVEFLASAIVDMKLHLTDEKNIDPQTFESDTLKELGMPSEIVMRHRIPQFNHLFSSEDYSAGYYGYLWADVLSADAFEAFTEAGGPYDKKVTQKFYENIVSVGNTVDPLETYKKFRGREPKVDALLRSRGFPVPTTKK